MKRLKNRIDEMQELNLLTIEKRGFCLAYFGLVVVILGQMLIYPENDWRYNAGETIVLFISSMYVIVAGIRKGLWDRRIPATPLANLMLSIIFSGIFALVLAIEKYMEFGSLSGAIAAGIVFFVFASILCLVILTLMTSLYIKRKKKLENELEE